MKLQLSLYEAIEREKIQMPTGKSDKGWNEAIDYILAEYGCKLKEAKDEGN